MVHADSLRQNSWPVPPRVLVIVALAVSVVVASGASLAVTSANKGVSIAKPEMTTSTAAVKVDVTTKGARIYANTFGISIEARALVQPQFSSGNLTNYLKTLGPGVLRVGGNSADRLFWTSSNDEPPEWAQGILDPAAIDRLAAVARASGWSVVLGLNLQHFDPERAADEVAYAKQALGAGLKAVAIGNQPNTYYKESTKFVRDFHAYTESINRRSPDVAIYGPQLPTAAKQFLSEFVDHQSKSKNADIAALSASAYAVSACEGKKTDIAQLFSSDTYAAEKQTADELVQKGNALELPTFMIETNSVACGGQTGVSDVYASSLWALSHGLAVAAEGLSGVYFHGSLAECGEREDGYVAYTPFCARDRSDAKKGNLVATPEYYGLLALTQLDEGVFVKVENPRWETLHAFAVQQTSEMKIVLVNVADPASNGAIAVKLNTNGSYHTAEHAQLTTEEKSLAAKSGITFGQNEVDVDGNFESAFQRPLNFDGKQLQVVVPAGTATVITLR